LVTCPMKNCQVYISEIEHIVGGNSSNGTVDLRFNWTKDEKTRVLVQHLRGRQKQLRALKKDINQTCKNICSEFVARQTSIDKRWGSRLAAALFGRKILGRMNTTRRRELRRALIDALTPYEHLKTAIDDIIDQLDQEKYAVETSEEYAKKPVNGCGQRADTRHLRSTEQRCYVFLDGEVVGPLTVEELSGLVKAKVANPDTNICIEGENDWHQLSHFSNQ